MPVRYTELIGSMTMSKPSCGMTVSSSCLSSSEKAYWKPAQPPPSTYRRSAFPCALGSPCRSSLMRPTALSVIVIIVLWLHVRGGHHPPPSVSPCQCTNWRFGCQASRPPQDGCRGRGPGDRGVAEGAPAAGSPRLASVDGERVRIRVVLVGGMLLAFDLAPLAEVEVGKERVAGCLGVDVGHVEFLGGRQKRRVHR